MSLIKCCGTTFSYEGKPALSNIDFEVNKGDYICVVGENGAGKSTLIKGLLGLIKPSEGKVETGDGLKLNEIGYLPQQTAAQKDFPASVYEVVLSGRLNSLSVRPFYNKADKAAVRKNMELLGITEMKNKCYRNLSGGQQQRVLLARALCATKKLILLDEPVTGLDPVMTAELYRVVKRLNTEENITVIMVSHDVHEAVNEANHILHLGHKQLFFGTTDEYKNSVIGQRFIGGESI